MLFRHALSNYNITDQICNSLNQKFSERKIHQCEHRTKFLTTRIINSVQIKVTRPSCDGSSQTFIIFIIGVCANPT